MFLTPRALMHSSSKPDPRRQALCFKGCYNRDPAP